MRKTLAKMKTLSLVLLAMVAIVLGACGAPFDAGSFTRTGAAGTQALGSGAGSGGAASAAGSGGAPDPMARAGASGAPDVIDSSSAGAPAAEPPFIPPACSSEKQVTGGYYGDLTTAPACLRTKEALNTIACGSWDNRSITVNGVPATCGVPLSFPPSADSFIYLAFGPGTSASVTIRWFLTAPSPQACQSRWWAQGDLYSPGEIMLEACDAPGSTSACELGKTYAFSCSGMSCSDTQPGGSGWTATWQIVTECG